MKMCLVHVVCSLQKTVTENMLKKIEYEEQKLQKSP